MTQSGKAVKLPVKNDLGFFEIRMESIGGLGANVAGKILIEAAIIGMGMNGAGFASYGSEKKGTPIKSFVRICEGAQQVRINSPVEEPHVLAIFHEALAKSVPVTAGAVPGKTAVILNTRRTPSEARDFLKLEGGKVGVVDAMEVAMATGSRVNMVMMGAIMKAAGFFEWKAAEEAVHAQFGKKYPTLMKANMDALKRGFDEVAFGEFPAMCRSSVTRRPRSAGRSTRSGTCASRTSPPAARERSPSSSSTSASGAASATSPAPTTASCGRRGKTRRPARTGWSCSGSTTSTARGACGAPTSASSAP
jgi:2-oxoacid:acceptor oxidoreductase gamma subunit (pyruvate/2-ketoisovalerate family)